MPSTRYRLWKFSCLLILSTLTPGSVTAAEPVEVAATAGRYSILDEDKGAEVGWELRYAARRLRFQPRWLPPITPLAGAMGTARGALYVYGGFGLDLPLGPGWDLRPSWAAGLFYQDGDRDLGGPLEFRSALELSRRISSRLRLGFTFYHLSNGGLFQRNPGSESLVLTLAARP
jgi:hypothetical protein